MQVHGDRGGAAAIGGLRLAGWMRSVSGGFIKWVAFPPTPAAACTPALRSRTVPARGGRGAAGREGRAEETAVAPAGSLPASVAVPRSPDVVPADEYYTPL